MIVDAALRHAIDRPECAASQQPAADRREHHAQRDEHRQGLHVTDQGLPRPAQRHRHLDQIDHAPAAHDGHREQARLLTRGEIDRLERGRAAQRVDAGFARERQPGPQRTGAHTSFRVEELQQGVGELRAEELAHERLEIGRQRRGRVRRRRVAEHAGHGEE